MSHSFSSFTAPFCANQVLATLSTSDLEQLGAYLKPCLLHTEQTLYEKGGEVKHVYFLKSGVVSLVLGSQTGMDVEVGVIGCEGVVGGLEALGQVAIATRAEVQIAGSGWRLPAEALRSECVRNPAIQGAILRAAHSLQQQTSQCVLCNRLHNVEQRLSRWLLMCDDRVGLQPLELTQEFLSRMLCVRRVGVTLAAGVLREAGLIEYSRGNLTILDRPGLESRACECYSALRAQLKPLHPAKPYLNVPSNDPYQNRVSAPLVFSV